MSIGLNQTGQVTVTTAGELIIALNPNREGVILTNTGSVTVFVGNVGVTATTGHAILAGTSATLTCVSNIYGITATGSAVVAFCEEQ